MAFASIKQHHVYIPPPHVSLFQTCYTQKVELLFFFSFLFYFFVLSYVGQVVRDRQDQPSLKGILRLPVGAPPVFFPRRRTTPLRRRRRRLVASLSMAQAQH